MRIYVASSWRNKYYRRLIPRIRDWMTTDSGSHRVYDFMTNGFHWSEIDPLWKEWTPEEYNEGLDHTIAVTTWGKDLEAMEWADLCILLLPSGRSAHLEAGWFAGRGKPLIIHIPEPIEPDLSHRMASVMTTTEQELEKALQYFHDMQ